jgi:hypothetical protein
VSFCLFIAVAVSAKGTGAESSGEALFLMHSSSCHPNGSSAVNVVKVFILTTAGKQYQDRGRRRQADEKAGPKAW